MQVTGLVAGDVGCGTRAAGFGAAADSVATADPVAVIQSVNALSSDDCAGIMVLQKFHRLLGSLEVIPAMSRQIGVGKQNRTFLVVLAPVVQIPIELEKQFVVIQHERVLNHSHRSRRHIQSDSVVVPSERHRQESLAPSVCKLLRRNHQP
ncbi:MAG: hypothetical protein ACKVHE_23910 [Planctomycetales bacterium]